MGAMSRPASVLTVVILLAAKRSSSKNCVIWSESGPPVVRGSSLSVFCHFPQTCYLKKITSDHPQPTDGPFNVSTILVKLVNVSENTSFRCQCQVPYNSECGLDLTVGYPPDRPENMSCSYIAANASKKDVHCTWDRGRKTYILDTTYLWVESDSGFHNNMKYPVHSGNSAKFSVPGDATVISVRVQTRNKLGAAASVIWNYILADIAKPPPPVLGQPNCSSRECTAAVTRVDGTESLQIQYRTTAAHQKWTTANSSQVLVSSLEPNTRYDFRARWKFRTGSWSEWSASVSSSTQEEAPAEPLDVWWTELRCESLHVYWKSEQARKLKGMNSSMARGKVLNYIVKVKNLNIIKNISAHERNTSVQFCPQCQVAVSACNSKGCSPPVIITCLTKEPALGLTVLTHNNSLSLTWPQSNSGIQETVVEWYRDGHKLDEVQWVRLSRDKHQTVITNVQPSECYKGAVHVFSHGNVRTMTFMAAIVETVPTVGPSVQDNIEADTVTVTWAEIPRGQRGGCIVKYNVYLENSIGDLWNDSIMAPGKTFTKTNLPPATYSLWMSASTAKGEGPAGRKIKFFISADNKLPVGLACGLLFVLGLFLLMLCQCPTLKHRLWAVVQYFYEVVPDPANSKWAKECSKEMGTIDFQLQLCEERITEDLPILVAIEELPQKTWDVTESSISPTLHYPLISDIKSHSQDSESSAHTEHSQVTTEEYISSHQPGYQEEEEEEEDEFEDMLCSFSDSFSDAQGCGGNLTLDAVKINCTN
ncbi:interleukin-12 receptor subunit beta-2 isoform X1 [Synchiropus splendidus]|uniref:interleukin-12 receptor subunit beta-2 isoform X1 n=1 Tax=Synchiropus splendidus TaxID=270530 RepID=UPI00237DC9BD|nr:interleukin-12 receptor subunit beta-2 isoform X1 [Synchiropus splendidus]